MRNYLDIELISRRQKYALIVLFIMSVIFLSCITTQKAFAGSFIRNISESPVSWNAGTNSSGNLPAAATVYVGNQYYLNMQVTTDVQVSKAILYVYPPNASSYQYNFSISNYIRWANYPCSFSSAGTCQYTWYLEYKGGGSDRFTNSFTVNRKSASVSIATSDAYVTYGSTFTRIASTNSNGSISYRSSNTSVATVNSGTGKVIPVGYGWAQITATSAQTSQYNSASATYWIYVNRANPTVSIASSDVTLTGKGSTLTRIATTSGNGTISYSSSNTDVATVNASGVVTSVGVGTAYITATSSQTNQYTSASASYKVTVTSAERTMNYAYSSRVVTYGQNVTNALSWTGDGIVSYTSSNTSVATVSSNGTVTTQGAGTTTITASAPATSLYKAKTASYVLTVNRASQSVTVPVTALNLTTSELFSLGARTTGNGTITYSSSNDSVVTISSKGLIFAAGEGSAVITVGASQTDQYAAAPSISISINVSRNKESLSGAAISDIANQVFSGSPIQPKPSVTLNGVLLVQGRDFQSTYSNNINVGTATLTITGIGNYAGSKSVTFKVVPANISSASIASIASQTYTGSSITPLPQVTYNDNILSNTVDYSLQYSSNINVGTASIVITGRGNFTNSKSVTFKINAASINSASIASIPDQQYTGSPITPKPTVALGGKTLVNETDYEYSYSSNIAVGTATVVVSGKSNYGGSRSVTFKIVGAKALTFDDLRFSFGNNADVFGYPEHYKIPLKSYQMIYGKVKAQSLYRVKGEWGGSCFGLAAASRLFNVNTSGLSIREFNTNANYVRDLKVTDKNRNTSEILRSYIEALQVSQYSGKVKKARKTNDLDEICSEVLKSKNTGKLVSIGIYGYTQDGLGGHALVGYDVEKVNSSEKRLFVYDCNYKNEKRYITISTNAAGKCTGWYYKFNNTYNWGSSYPGGEIDYTPYAAIEDVWRYGGDDSSVNTLITNTQSFDVSDVEGNNVAKVRNGVLVASIDEITQVVSLEGLSLKASEDEDAGNVILQMPSDIVYVVNNLDASIEYFNGCMVNDVQSANVITGAKEVAFAVNDDEEVNLVDIDAKSGETYSVSLDSELASAKGQENIEFSGIGTGVKLSAGTILGNYIVANGRTASLFVNGESVDLGNRQSVSDMSASLEYTEVMYDGKPCEPKVTVINDGKSLTEGKDYIVTYSNNNAVGIALATVYGIGDYDGKFSRSYRIIERAHTGATTAAIGLASGKTTIVSGATYKVTSNVKATVVFQKAPKSKGNVIVPAAVTIKGKKYVVTGIAKEAFKGTKTKTVTVKSKKLTKKSVRGCLKGSKVKTVKVPKAKKNAYKKYFAKGNVGRKVKVK